jgi:hypothetical protein
MAVPAMAPRAYADKGAAFIGGVLAGHVVSGAVHRSKVRTAAEVQQASQPTVVYQQAPATTHTQAAPATSGKGSAEQRIQQLDKLAAGGYITPEEYKAKKKAILDSL